jgi:predicted nucleic acid-binding protein
MSVSVSIKVRKEIVELADKMVKYGLARSRNHAFNVLIEKGLSYVKKEVEYWESVYRMVEELKKKGFKLSHGGLNELLAEDRER